MANESKRVEKQEKRFTFEEPSGTVHVAIVRYDDCCHNGYNTFSITCDTFDRGFIHGESYVVNSHGHRRYLGACGCQHDVVRQFFPNLAPFIRWHLVSTDGPLHYIANTRYHAGYRSGFLFLEGTDLQAARSCAVAPDATVEQLVSEEWLKARLPVLLEEFRRDVESLGFTW